jgi:hydrogenase nickel incorporation protein HypB
MSTRIVELRRGILKKNDELAAGLRARYADAGVLVLNLVSSPGTGKTAFLEITLRELRARGARVAALVGDLETDNDARRLASSGAPVRQINTHGICHLEAEMVSKHLEGWELADLDILFIENVGNLVCPSSYDLGERVRVALLSVTEGEDKPLKYPTLFNSADAAVITKMDLAEPCGFDRDLAVRNIREIRPGIRIFETSAKTGAGMKEWLDYLEAEQGGRESRALAVPSIVPSIMGSAEVQTSSASKLIPAETIQTLRGPSETRPAPSFATAREAKEFLIDWIDAEARRVGTPLSDVERKILYASEKGWTLPDMDDVQDAFERYHDPSEYEEKMGKLIRGIRHGERDGNPADYDAWTEAVRVLSREDHYLLELIAAAGGVRKRGGHLGLWLGVVAVCGALAAIALMMKH